MLAVTQVIIGSDREMCRLFQLLSQELCLILLGSSPEWTVNDNAGVHAISLVCTRGAPLSSLPLIGLTLLGRAGSLLNDFLKKVIDCIGIKLHFLRFGIFILFCEC